MDTLGLLSYLALVAELMAKTTVVLCRLPSTTKLSEVPVKLDCDALFLKPLMPRMGFLRDPLVRQRVDASAMFRVLERLSRVCGFAIGFYFPVCSPLRISALVIFLYWSL